MKLIICLDNQNGLMFNRRRQSKDALLRQHILDACGSHRLWMNAYTASQFEQPTDARICVDEQFLERAEMGDFCFAEDIESVKDRRSQLEALYIYRWNRSYPFDLSFKDSMEELHLHRVSTADLVGSSHEKITEEIWKP
jgi:hypothetical protein